MIGVIDYGINNIGSVLNAIKYLDIKNDVVSNPDKLSSYKMLILPGVGSFDSGVKALKSNGMFEALKDISSEDVKIFGICLGMQLLCNESEEGSQRGLGLLDAKVIHLKNTNCSGKIPHVGFNSVCSSSNDNFLQSMLNNDYYFVHSYAVKTNSKIIKTANSEYEGTNIIAAYKKDNIYGTQFHPEKSGLKGLDLISKAYKC